MKALICRSFVVVAVALLVAAPAAAVDVGAFRLDQGVRVGSYDLPAGVYVFKANDRGFVLVTDEKDNIVAAALTRRAALSLSDREKAGTLAHDWAVRSVALGDFEYGFWPGNKPTTIAARPLVTVNRIALAR